ncbi:30S ribosomal protein S1, chloroplastic [Apostasia shenzhenica]|uniref:30S ribosomal protein S1, chloroplastic n=1 Tax=Apostasia shenzhenica TaxID=1088818 RepID=A0A2I0AZG6_9ASPA|nr:30S ribosomal protein S1, chloroplastic [Apostasia shenzhenica]
MFKRERLRELDGGRLAYIKIKQGQDPQKSIKEIAKDLVGSSLRLKVVEVNEEEKKLTFSEKDANWAKYSSRVKVGDVFDARVGSVEDYGAFVHLLFPDGLVHVSEVSWDLVQDVSDFLSEGEQVKVKVIHINREKLRLTLSIKQLEEDPLLETLDKVIPQKGDFEPDSNGMRKASIDPFPGLESICKELLQEDGLAKWPPYSSEDGNAIKEKLLSWIDREHYLSVLFIYKVQEVHLTTTLDQEGIKEAVQRVLGRVP